MDDLVKMVSEKIGISEAQALEAVQMVLGFIKERVGEPLAGQIDGLLAGGSMPQGMPDIGDMAQGLGDMFGKK